MKRAVIVSLGSSKRNKAVEIELLGEKISIERIGTDGDMEKAAQLYAEMDGKVDAFGVGGTDLGLLLDETWYPLHSINSMVNTVKQTPDVEICRGAGVKYLVTTTPVIEGRSFGTNMMEAALIAISGKGRKLTYKEYGELLDQLNFELNIMELN